MKDLQSSYLKPINKLLAVSLLLLSSQVYGGSIIHKHTQHLLDRSTDFELVFMEHLRISLFLTEFSYFRENTEKSSFAEYRYKDMLLTEATKYESNTMEFIGRYYSQVAQNEIECKRQKRFEYARVALGLLSQIDQKMELNMSQSSKQWDCESSRLLNGILLNKLQGLIESFSTLDKKYMKLFGFMGGLFDVVFYPDFSEISRLSELETIRVDD